MAKATVTAEERPSEAEKNRNQSTKKPIPPAPRCCGKVCPVCGKAAYSRDGVHPQCAMQQADAPRIARLQAEKKKIAKAKKPKQRSWNKKCPQCHAEVHVRRTQCECGHDFARA